MRPSAATNTATPAATSTSASTSTRAGWWRSANARLCCAQVLLALGYVAAATPKLGHDPRLVANFAELGVTAMGMHAIGVLELAGAAGLLIPCLVGAAATALAALMVGAVTLTVADIGVLDAAPPALYLGAAGAVAWYRRDRTTRLVRELAHAVRRPSTWIGRSHHG
jgi:uncharacterized membrane protein YphA (DoxX/SURF4 family)